METRTGGLRTRWLVLVLGGILLATTVLFGPVTNADAQGQSQAKGKKAQGQSQGQVQDADEAEGGGGQEKVTLCHKGKNTITVGAPAVKAHEAHGDVPGACDDSGAPPPPPPPPGSCLAGVEVTAETDTETTGVVNKGDVLFVPGENLTLSADPIITVKSGETQHTFDSSNATFALSEDPEATGILIRVNTTPTGELPIQGLAVESTEGIECGEVTAIGTLAMNRSGDVTLRTKDGKGDSKAVPLVAQTQDQEERLEELATSKLGKVKVTGVKVKDKSAKKGAKVKGQERKEALKVTSVKKANKNK